MRPAQNTPVVNKKQLKDKPSNRYDRIWEANFKRLLKFVKREDHAWVVLSHEEDGFKLGQWVTEQRHRKKKLSRNRVKALEELEGWSWNRIEDAWARAFGLLLQFVDREGHALVPERHEEEEFSLGSWVVRQRAKKKGMSRKRKSALNSVEGWSWNVSKDRWNHAFELLKKYTDRESHALVPGTHCENGFKLGQWVNDRRRRKETLSISRVRALESLKNWSWAPLEEEWNYAFGLLEEFLAREGHAVVPYKHVEEGFGLGIWVMGQRLRRYSMKRELSVELESLKGWSWSPDEDYWNNAFGLLKEYTLREGHAQVPKRYVEKGFKLGQWVQRQRGRRTTMPDKSANALEALNGWTWNPIEDRWKNGFERLNNFAEKNGHTLVSRIYVEDGFRLGIWVRSQRKIYRENRLLEERRVLLEGLPGWTWKPKEERKWLRGFDCLLTFVRREGHMGVPNDHVEGRTELGSWIDWQLDAYANGTLTEARRVKLEDIPYWRCPKPRQKNFKYRKPPGSARK